MHTYGTYNGIYNTRVGQKILNFAWYSEKQEFYNSMKKKLFYISKFTGL